MLFELWIEFCGMVLEEGCGDNHELGDNYSYYVTLIVYLSTIFCNYPNYPGSLFIGQLCLKCVRSWKIFERPILFDPFSCFLFRVFPLSMLVGVFVNFVFIFICRCVWKSPRFVLSCGVCTIFVRVCCLCVLVKVWYRFLCVLRWFWVVVCCHSFVVIVCVFSLDYASPHESTSHESYASHESEGEARLWRVWWVCLRAFSSSASVEFDRAD